LTETNNPLPLARVVEDLRRELLEAIRLGEGQALRFKLKPFEVEFQVAVTREAGAEGGVRFWVVNLGAKGSITNEVTHTLKLTLEPVYGDAAGEVLVGGEGRR